MREDSEPAEPPPPSPAPPTAKVARQVPSMAKLLEAREQLANLLRYMDGKVAAEDQLKKLLADPQLMAALRDRAARDEPEAEK